MAQERRTEGGGVEVPERHQDLGEQHLARHELLPQRLGAAAREHPGGDGVLEDLPLVVLLTPRVPVAQADGKRPFGTIT